MEQMSCRCITASEYDEYLRFARIAWGDGSVQASRTRLDWLYGANPYTQGAERDLFALFDGDRIVGSHHRMQLPWRVGEAKIIFPTCHDLYVLSEYRRGGGLELITAPLKGQRCALLFGLSAQAEPIYSRLQKAYSRLRTDEVRSFWLQKVYRRFSALPKLLLFKAGVVPRVKLCWREEVRTAIGLRIQVTPQPDNAQIEAALSCTPDASIYTDWDEKSFRWRFFHAAAPPHLLLLVFSGAQCLGRAVLSFGIKHGLPLGRLVELTAPHSPAALSLLLEEIDRSLLTSGVAIALAATTDANSAAALSAKGWAERKNPARTRIFMQDHGVDLSRCHIWGGSWDFGMDLPARVTLRSEL
jgi:hypothetical protein